MSQKSGGSSKKLSRTQMRREARNYALQALYQWQMAGAAPVDIEAQFHVDPEKEMNRVDTELFRELLHGVSAKASLLDEQVTTFLDRKLDDLDPVELSILRMGTYELAYRLEVPYKVVINESVNLAKTFGATDSHKYVNGVLDKLALSLRKVETTGR